MGILDTDHTKPAVLGPLTDKERDRLYGVLLDAREDCQRAIRRARVVSHTMPCTESAYRAVALDLAHIDPYCD